MLREAAKKGEWGHKPRLLCQLLLQSQKIPRFPFHIRGGPLDWNYRRAKSRNGKQLILKDLGENLFWSIYSHPYSKHVLKPCEKYPKPASTAAPASVSAAHLPSCTNRFTAAPRWVYSPPAANRATACPAALHVSHQEHPRVLQENTLQI